MTNYMIKILHIYLKLKIFKLWQSFIKPNRSLLDIFQAMQGPE